MGDGLGCDGEKAKQKALERCLFNLRVVLDCKEGMNALGYEGMGT